MKVEIDGKQVIELNETQKKVIQNDIPSELFENDMTRRCKYWLEIPCEKFVNYHREKIKEEFNRKNINSIPVNDVKLGKRFAEEFPTKYGYKDIKASKICRVGNQHFEFSTDHQHIWRKMLGDKNDKLTTEAFLESENKILEERIAWILKHKYERCIERLKAEWFPKLEQRGIDEIPLNDEAFAELVFAQADYKNRSQREADED